MSQARDCRGKPTAFWLRDMPGAEADEGRPRKPAWPLARKRGLAAKARCRLFGMYSRKKAGNLILILRMRQAP
jgi:hypothetical protein